MMDTRKLNLRGYVMDAQDERMGSKAALGSLQIPAFIQT
jgi:hypothetical protein